MPTVTTAIGLRILSNSTHQANIGERGAETIEFVAVLPLLLLMMVLIWQMALVGYTAVAAQGAANQAARAYSQTDDASAAVAAAAHASPSWTSENRTVTPSSDATGMITVQVALRVPEVPLPLIGFLPQQAYPFVPASVTMAAEPGAGSLPIPGGH